MCYLLVNIYKFLIKDANWHALPIDEYLQNFQLINERFLIVKNALFCTILGE